MKYMETWMELQALTWPCLVAGGYLGSEPVDGRSLSFLSVNTFPIKRILTFPHYLKFRDVHGE